MTKVLGALASQAALATAILFYYGWIRTRASYQYFGIDTSLLHFGVSDYLLRSVSSAFSVVVGTCAALAVGISLRNKLQELALRRTPRMAHLVGRLLSAVGWSLLLVPLLGILGVQPASRLGIWLPVLLCAAATALLASAHLGRLYQPVDAGTSLAPSSAVWSLSLVTILVVGYFWAVTFHAAHAGTRLSTDRAQHLVSEPAVALYSKERLAISGHGLDVQQLKSRESDDFKYRYIGLRLLIYTNARYFLLPAEWRRGRDAVFVIGDEPSVRIDVVAH